MSGRKAGPGNLKGPGSGRPKGSKNKLSMSVKLAIEEAFEKAGGVKYLVKVAEENPAVFCQLLARLIPPTIPEGMKAGAGLVFLCPTE